MGKKMTGEKRKASKRNYAIDDDALAMLDARNELERTAKEAIVSAGIRLFEACPLAVRSAALSGDAEALKSFFRDIDLRDSVERLSRLLQAARRG